MRNTGEGKKDRERERRGEINYARILNKNIPCSRNKNSILLSQKLLIGINK